ncbi:zinc-dependent metalloprotease [Oscillatoria sp. CS-180]|uniref:zinc-dependent metalloprotease n=1 Tax=Oscillatoria sp. CS-180 TaxID=3021720 RepID=UPI00232B11A3|nr:zinc-dependent metalloprotease [Oscillatoria sp. CS-180]MDB9525636.1 zinc-dependent metalloprotease [Oscillatoria sp. CS-180]
MIRQIRPLKFLALCLLGLLLAAVLALTSLGGNTYTAHAQDADDTIQESDVIPEEDEDAETTLRPFEEVVEGLDKQEGLFTLYSDLDKGDVYLALQPGQLNRNFLLMATLESGVGEAGLFRGWPVNDLLIQFREMPGDRLQIVVPNTYIRNPSGEARQQRLLDTSFSDSIILAVDIISIEPNSQAKLIDLSNLIMERDLADISQSMSWILSSYSRNPELSSINTLKAFPKNLEIETTAAFSGGGTPDPLAALFGLSLQGIPDNRGFALSIRYSLSELPTNNGFKSRYADERVGYFPTVFRAPVQSERTDTFVRYINRWHLEKQDSQAELSPPEEPIVFWIENTVPEEYRDSLRKGILLWNEAFETAGFQDAIEVRQMPDSAEWDPSDVRYNVIRWSDSLDMWALGFGPSRVNPFTGEILDADIILDANVVRALRQQYQTRGLDSAPETEFYLQLCGQRSQSWYLQWLAMQQYGEAGLEMTRNSAGAPDFQSSHRLTDDHCAGYLSSQHNAFGALALSVLSGADFSNDKLEDYIQQYLVVLTAHEVGHTLGLRHNFAGSRLLDPEDLNNPTITQSQGLVSSIMDYFPPNIAPPGIEQGEYFPSRLGPYDIWAIEYGYREAPPSPLRREEQRMLNEILSRSTAPELAYATDEDIVDFIDPEAGAWDLSNDPLQYAEWQIENAKAVWSRLNRLSVSPGEGYGSLRRRVDLVFGYFFNNTLTLTDYIGGQRFRRVDPWETRGQTPFEPIPAEKQREALATLNAQVFASDAFNFSSQLLNQLAPDRWRHWGVALTRYPLDYPIYERVLEVQSIALSELMLSDRLARVRDLEFKTDAEDVLTLAELYESLYQSIWSEVTTAEENGPAVSSLRRGLQRHHLNILSNLVLRRTFWDALSAQSFTEFMAALSTLGAPEDARVMARYQLRQIQQDVEDTLSRYGGRMEVTTQAHLEDARDRITRVLEAPLIGL